MAQAALLPGLEEHRQGLAHALFQKAQMHPGRKRLGLMGAGGFHGVGALPRHGVRRSAGPPGVGENVHVRKGALLNKGQGLGLVLLRLAGKAGDQIGGDGAAGEPAPQPLHGFVVPGCVVLPVHGLQDPVAAGLEGQVKMAAELAAAAGLAAEVLGDQRGLQGAQAQAHGAGDGGHRVDQIPQIRLPGQIHPVGGHLNAGEHQLPEAQIPQPLRLGHGVLQGQAAQPPPGVGDDAVAAEVDAAVLDLEHGPGPAGQGPGGQLLIAPALEGPVDAGLLRSLGHCLLHRPDKIGPVGGAEDHPAADLPGLLGAELGITAADGQHRTGILVP